MAHFLHLACTPSGAARTVVRDCWLIEAETCRTRVERVLPSATVELYFNLGSQGRFEYQGSERCELPARRAWVVGPRARSLLVEKEISDCDMVTVRLELGAAARAFGVPARDLAGSLIDLDLFWGSAVETIRDQLASRRDHASRLQFAVTSILSRTADAVNTCADDLQMRALCRALTESHTRTITDVAAELGMSHRRVIALFDQRIGLKPKVFQRVQRLRRALQHIHREPRPSFTRIAHLCGYFDQAHFAHDFEQLAGISPAEYDARRSSVGRGFAQHLAARSL